jgi:hypothetical protein
LSAIKGQFKEDFGKEATTIDAVDSGGRKALDGMIPLARRRSFV